MNIYYTKQRWKWILIGLVTSIFAASIVYSNFVVKRVSNEERDKIKIWADAIQRKAAIVNYTEEFFERIREEERRRANLLAKAYNKLATSGSSEDITFYLELISNNKTIPVILTDEERNINGTVNFEINTDSVRVLEGELLEEFSQFKPISINYYGKHYMYLYYKESQIYSDLRTVIDDLIESFFNEVVVNSASVPVIITDSTKSRIITFGNMQLDSLHITEKADSIIKDMSQQNLPIEIQIHGLGKSFVFYKESVLLSQLRYFPYVQFFAIAVFLLVAYLLFSISRRSEQDQVWVGMSKETAHQLGTPLSSLIGWIEMLRLQNVSEEIIAELEKDVQRLDVIAQRFSKIGSSPELKKENLVKVINDFVEYYKTRTSSKINFYIYSDPADEINLPLNRYLFEWVIENLCKNAVDAMSGAGNINFEITTDSKRAYIDISDTGKGLAKKDFQTIFKPGYTSKPRGWGLGLSLAYRIIKKYHKGKIFVKSAQVGKGTTFRIVLRKK
ncbi:MAG: HAMP domain-containing sensor histidine kinase [Bacteroidales bacterium]|nr:HAMP domain-containing sensor histidine kinase [Bacteroidales bacterium]MDD4576455.1 HAMP domain-containing sensor histidine kinase [Bacteroidales bacterium]